ncbi:MAG: sugar transferase [Bulleidia sp.]|nr:sugar transferase [Bulleidia sp.]
MEREYYEQRNKKNLSRKMQLRFMKVLDIVLMTIPFAVCWYSYYTKQVVYSFYRRGNWMVITLNAVLYISFARLYGALDIETNRISELVFNHILSTVMAGFFMYIVAWLLARVAPSVAPLLGAFLAQIFIAVGWSYFAHRWFFKTFGRKKACMIYEDESRLEDLQNQKNLGVHYDVVTTLKSEEALSQLSSLDDMETVFVCGIHSHERNQIVKYCIDHGIEIFDIPRIGDVIMSGAQKMHMYHLPMLQVERYNPAPEYLFFKRFFDIVLSAIALVILSPLLIVIAIIIKATDGGTVFYKQTRLTRDGKEFKLIKFRSMRMDAEKDGVARLSTGESDSRITPIGRFIRKCRIDELPQLLNILKGDMSIVGPRPERPEIAKQYEDDLPEFALRLQAKAGLTGYAQVYGKYNTTPYDKLLMDLMYIAKPSLAEDFRICLATVAILFQKESTEGVAEGSITAEKKHEDQA